MNRLFAAFTAAVMASGAWAETQTVSGYTWTYRIMSDGGTEIFYDNGYGGDTAVSPKPNGTVHIPTVLGSAFVTSIGPNALRACDDMISVVIPESVTNIADYAFYRCENLETAEVGSPYGVRRIGNSAFSECRNLETVNLSDVLESIGNQAFAFTSLDSITIPASVTNIGNQAFAACQNLDIVRYLGNCPKADMIYNNAASNLQSVVTDGTTGWDAALKAGKWQDRSIRAVLPKWTDAKGFTWTYCTSNGVARIYNNGDVAVDPLPTDTLYVPASLGGKPVTSIGAYALYSCTDLTYVSIPSSVTNIEESAFQECTALDLVTIPAGVSSIGEKAFFGCSVLETVTLPKNLKVIGTSAFESCTELKDVTIPASVTNIGEAAFFNCESITSLTIPASVKTIGYAAFSGCDTLKRVTYLGACPETLPDLYDGTPADLESVVTEGAEGWDEAIEAGKWQNRNLRTVLPKWTDGKGYTWTYRVTNGEVEINNWSECAVTPEPTGAVTVPSSIGGKPVTKIGRFAFSQCKGMTSVTIPDSVKEIDDVAFFGCDGLADKNGFVIVRNVVYGYVGAAVDVTVPAGVTRIGGMAFMWRSALRGNPSLVSVTLPASVTGIADAAFAYCTELKSVTRLDEIDDIGDGAFFYCFEMADENGFVIVNNVMHGYYGDATTIRVPSGVTRIGSKAFNNELGCNLQEVTIPKSVKEIGFHAFESCVQLQTVIYLCDCPSLPDDLADIYYKTAIGLESWVSPSAKGWDEILDYGYWQGAIIRKLEVLEPKGPMYTVTFDPNGGTADLISIAVEEGDTIWEFPTATREGYTLDGWWTAKSGGTKVTMKTTVTQDMTVYAHWKKTGGGSDPVNPDPEKPCYVAIEAGDVKAPYAVPKAVALHGVAYDGCEPMGIVELKLGKVNAKKGTGKVSGSFVGPDGKKLSIKSATITGIDGTAPASVVLEVKGLGKMSVTIGGDSFAGSIDNSWHVQTADVGGEWAGQSATVTVDAGDISMFTGNVLADLLPKDETADVVRGKWSFAKAAGVKWGKPKKNAPKPDIYDADTGKGLILDTSKGKTNLSGMKLNYTYKKGTFKGSFKVYALEGTGKSTKLKKYAMNVTGIVVDGVGYGQATCKKPAARWAVTVK
ncbi:MAG: leucine-rich repeat protein [Kiritimatiellae bacterium]|nr:leucine-rich repeat protein [Kiritimatiellia bacterium]